jgi:hypothetical protein
MKTKLKLVAALVTALFTAACGQQGGTFEEPAQMRWTENQATGCRTGVGTTGNSMDASFTEASKVCRHPVTGEWHEVKSDGTFGPTVGGQAVVAVAGTAAAAAINVAGGIAIAEIKRDSGGPAVVNQNVVGSRAESSSGSNVGVGVDVDVTNALPCAKQGSCKSLGH